MSAAVIPLTGVKESRRENPNNPATAPGQNRNEPHIDGAAMTKAEREELAELREMVHQMVAAATVTKLQAQPQANGSKWFMAAIASITILGAAGNFVGSSGMWVGRREQQADQLVGTIKKLEDRLAYQETWNEKLRNNMAAYGWLIDRDGNVSRVEQQQRRR